MTVFTCDAAVDVLLTTLGAVSGIDKAIKGRPTSKQPSRIVYIVADRGTRKNAGQISDTWHYVQVTLCVSMQDNWIAEEEIIPYLNSIPAAIDANPSLSNTCNEVRVESYLSDIRPIGEVECRVVDFTVAIHQKASYGSGI